MRSHMILGTAAAFGSLAHPTLPKGVAYTRGGGGYQKSMCTTQTFGHPQQRLSPKKEPNSYQKKTPSLTKKTQALPRKIPFFNPPKNH